MKSYVRLGDETMGSVIIQTKDRTTMGLHAVGCRTYILQRAKALLA
jgi:hypothetical protein